MVEVAFAAHEGMLRLLGVFLVSGLKFIVAPFMSMKLGFSYSQTLVFTAVGGIAGVWFFYHLSHIFVAIYHRYFTEEVYPFLLQSAFFRNHFVAQEKKKIFSRKTRLLSKILSKYGLLYSPPWFYPFLSEPFWLSDIIHISVMYLLIWQLQLCVGPLF